MLGYDIDPKGKFLVVNETEAGRVRKIFELYAKLQSMIAVIAEIDKKAWLNKEWTTRSEKTVGGKPFTKTSLQKLLTNVTYTGKIRYKDEIHPGKQPAIVSPKVWQQVQTVLDRNRRTGGAPVRNKFGALLKGLIRCVPCDCAMVPTHTTRGGNKRYRYYVCSSAQKRGWDTCPSKAIPAPEIEKFVVDQIRKVGLDPELIESTVEQVHRDTETRLAELVVEENGLNRDLGRWNAELRDVARRVAAGGDGSGAAARFADLEQRANGAKERVEAIKCERDGLNRQVVTKRDVETALREFNPIWEALALRERARVIQLLVANVDYDGHDGKVGVTFHPEGIREFNTAFGGEE